MNIIEIPKSVAKLQNEWSTTFYNYVGEVIMEMTYEDESEEYSEEYNFSEVTVWTAETSVTYHNVVLTAPSGVANGTIYRNVLIDGEYVGTVECHNLMWNLGQVLINC